MAVKQQRAAGEHGLALPQAGQSLAQTTLGNNRVQWVVERMCNAPLPVSDVYSQCQVSQTQQTGSNRGGWGVAIQNDPVKYYRVTVRVTGPKSTEQFIQSLVSR